MNVQIDSLEDTTFEVTLGLTDEQEAAREAELHAPKAQPEWVTKNQFAAEDAPPARVRGLTREETLRAAPRPPRMPPRRRRRRSRRSGCGRTWGR